LRNRNHRIIKSVIAWQVFDSIQVKKSQRRANSRSLVSINKCLRLSEMKGIGGGDLKNVSLAIKNAFFAEASAESINPSSLTPADPPNRARLKSCNFSICFRVRNSGPPAVIVPSAGTTRHAREAHDQQTSQNQNQRRNEHQTARISRSASAEERSKPGPVLKLEASGTLL
jgi:hypothetical protein